jgi:hypothetical protein
VSHCRHTYHRLQACHADGSHRANLHSLPLRRLPLPTTLPRSLSLHASPPTSSIHSRSLPVPPHYQRNRRCPRYPLCPAVPVLHPLTLGLPLGHHLTDLRHVHNPLLISEVSSSPSRNTTTPHPSNSHHITHSSSLHLRLIRTCAVSFSLLVFMSFFLSLRRSSFPYRGIDTSHSFRLAPLSHPHLLAHQHPQRHLYFVASKHRTLPLPRSPHLIH